MVSLSQRATLKFFVRSSYLQTLHKCPWKNTGMYGNIKFPSVFHDLRNKQVFIWTLLGTFLPSWVANLCFYFFVIQSCFTTYNITVHISSLSATHCVQCMQANSCKNRLTSCPRCTAKKPTTEEKSRATTTQPTQPRISLSSSFSSTFRLRKLTLLKMKDQVKR